MYYLAILLYPFAVMLCFIRGHRYVNIPEVHFYVTGPFLEEKVVEVVKPGEWYFCKCCWKYTKNPNKVR